MNDAALLDYECDQNDLARWDLHVEREREAGRCPYCTWGLIYDTDLGYHRSCMSCDGSGVALPN